MDVRYFFAVISLGLLISPAYAEEKNEKIEKASEHELVSKCGPLDPRCH
jgi:hypothetical protein